MSEPALALVLPHRDRGFWGRSTAADCYASETAVRWRSPQVNVCPQCGLLDILEVLLNGAQAAHRSGIEYSTWAGHGSTRRRPLPDYIDGACRPFWLVSSIDRWNLSRQMFRTTRLRIKVNGG